MGFSWIIFSPMGNMFMDTSFKISYGLYPVIESTVSSKNHYDLLQERVLLEKECKVLEVVKDVRKST